MKKISLFLAFSFVCIFSIVAQEDEENSDGKNVFIGIGAKGNFYVNDKGSIGTIKVLEQTSLAGDLFFGKWFSHKVGGRIFLEGGSLWSFYSNGQTKINQNYFGGRLDLLINATNLFRPYSPTRFYNFIPYIGAGGLYTLDAPNWRNVDISDISLMFGGGLLNTFRFSNRISMFIDIGAHAVNIDKKIDLNGENQFGGLEGLISPSIGFVFNFGKSKPKEIIQPPIQPPVQQEEIRVVLTPATKPEPKPEPASEPPQVEPEPIIPFSNNVFFRFNSVVIDASQRNAIANTAEYLKDNPTVSVTIVGYADKETGYPSRNMMLSEKRAKNVAKELAEKYKIDSNRLKVEWKGDTVQPFAKNEQNRVVMILE